MAQAGMEVATLAGLLLVSGSGLLIRSKGVQSVESGYIGGQIDEPTHEQVWGRTGHAEAVRATFDPAVVSFRDLLEIFFA